MNKKLLTVLCFGFALFVACSGSDNLTGVTTESNDIANHVDILMSSSSVFAGGPVSGGTMSSAAVAPGFSSGTTKKISSASASIPTSSTAEIIQDIVTETRKAALDSILSSLEGNGGFSQNKDSTQSPTTSSSKTAYDFKTSGQVYYEQTGCVVQLYESERGVQSLSTERRGYFMQTTIVFDEENVLLQMVNNNYWGGDIVTDCRADSTSFRKNCESRSGVFRNYRNGSGCESIGGVLQVACAIPISEKSTVPELLKEEAEMYKRECESELTRNPAD